MIDLCERGQKCSCWFDGWFGRSWASCCEQHDSNYIYQLTKTKEDADNIFYECLKKRAGRLMAWVMYQAVKRSKVSQKYWDMYKNQKKG